MCLASKYLTQIDSLVENIKSDMKKLQKKQSDYDKAISDVYHKIEVTKFNACEGFLFIQTTSRSFTETENSKE